MDFIKENWDLIKETLRTEYDLSDISYNTWVKPLNFHSVKDDIVTIMIPSDQAHALKYISSKRSFPLQSCTLCQSSASKFIE